jgi:hypothetical protein
MGRKLYSFRALFTQFLAISLIFSSVSWGWTSFTGKVGSGVTKPYQSSNPTVELKTTRSINQQQSEECYLFSFGASLEIANLNGWRRPLSPEISGEYLFVQKLLAWSKEVLTNNSNISDSFYFLDGGDVHHAMKLSVDSGLLPQQFFEPRIPFEKWDFTALYNDIKALVVEGRKVLAKAKNENLHSQILEVILKNIQNRISLEAGPQREEFIWGGRKWNVHSFENAYGIKRNSHLMLMYVSGQWDLGDPWDLRQAILELVATFRGAFNYKQSSWNQIWDYTIKAIDQGLPALLSMKWAGSYHVMNVVGYEYNSRDEVINFKLKNTWGDEYGDHGHAFYGIEDLQKNVTGVWGFSAP